MHVLYFLKNIDVLKTAFRSLEFINGVCLVLTVFSLIGACSFKTSVRRTS